MVVTFGKETCNKADITLTVDSATLTTKAQVVGDCEDNSKGDDNESIWQIDAIGPT